MYVYINVYIIYTGIKNLKMQATDQKKLYSL